MSEANLKVKTTMNQGTIAPDGTIGYHGTGDKLGTSNVKSVQSAFASSPIYAGAESKVPGEDPIALDPNNPTAYREWFFKNVVKGKVNDKSYGLGQFDREFGNAPNLGEVDVGGAGLPATPFTPNPTSPGEGSADNAKAIAPASEAFVKSIDGKVAPFSGDGIAAQRKLSDSAKSIVDRQS